MTASDDDAMGNDLDAVARLRTAKPAGSANTNWSDVASTADLLMDRTATVEKE